MSRASASRPHRVPGAPARDLATWPETSPVRLWMRAPVMTIGVDTSVHDAVDLMRKRGVRHLPVVDTNGHLIGIVTDRDLRQVLFGGFVREPIVRALAAVSRVTMREVMTWGVVTARPDTDLRQAARLMRERKIGALPVVRDGKVVGLLTETDLIRALEEVLATRVRTVRPLRTSTDNGTYEYGFPTGGESGSAGAPD